MSEKTIGATIARQVRSYRKGRGWSVKRLADECARLGAPQLTVPSLVNIERGQRESVVRKGRDVTVEELAILGWALEVTPLLLAVPLASDELIAVTPCAAATPTKLWLHMTGVEPLVIRLTARDDTPGQAAD